MVSVWCQFAWDLAKILFNTSFAETIGEKRRKGAHQDPSHYGSYQIELEAKIPGRIQPTREALESYGFLLVDFDQWGLTYLSSKDPHLIADVDELDD